MANWLTNLFSYDAVDTRNRRRSKAVNLGTEDKLLNKTKRRRLVSGTRDLQRNFTVAAWAIRKHLCYTTTFEFQCRTGDKQLDDRIEQLIEWYARPFNCDVTGRHSLYSLIRMAENRALVDGDVFLLKLSDGKLQAIEGDRVQTPVSNLPSNFNPERWIHGVQITPSGKPVAYAVCDRDRHAKSIVPTQFIFELGYYDRFDQVRGVSPLAAAVNQFQDLYECAEYALAKAKVSQLFGLKFTRAGDEILDGSDGSDTSYDFGSGPVVLDLPAGDDAEFLESRTPSTEFASYCQAMTQAALKSLDIPYSFFSENFTNYSGARQALLQYEQSAAARRREIVRLLNNITIWRLQLFVQDGILELPRGMTVGDLPFEWIGCALPWIDPQKEANAEIALVNASLASRQDICKQHGKDWWTVVEKLAQEQRYMSELGIAATTDPLPIINEDEADEEQ